MVTWLHVDPGPTYFSPDPKLEDPPPESQYASNVIQTYTKHRQRYSQGGAVFAVVTMNGPTFRSPGVADKRSTFTKVSLIAE